MTKISKRVVDAAQGTGTEFFIWDEDLPGFGLRVLKSGKKTYQVQYRQGGRTRRMSLGAHGKITPDQARKTAKELLGSVAGGDDPSLDRSIIRKMPSVAEICDRFIAEHAKPRCKPKTVEDYERIIRLFVLPAFGAHKINDITRTDVSKLHHEMRGKPYQANRTLAVLSKLFNQCEVWGLRPDGSNPCRHVKKFKEVKRERFLSEEELQRLWQTLDECEKGGSESPSACNAYRLLILTGCRLGEIQTLKWDYIKDDGIYLPDSKTGAKKLYIGQPVRDALDKITKIEGNPYVITGTVPGQHLNNLQKPWRRIRKKAELDDLRIHDLRHSFASFGLANGLGLAEIGKLLGHTQTQTTARYAHLAEKYAAAAAEKTASFIAAAINPDGGA